MSFFKAYKTLIISFLIDLSIAVILVSIFRSSYSNDSFISDVILYFFVIAIITILLGIKNGFVTYLTTFFIQEDEINEVLNHLIKYNYPKPTDWYDIDNPEDYFTDVVNDELNTSESRIHASSVVTMYTMLRGTYKFVNLYLYSKLMKKVLRKYLKYCEKNI